MTEREPGMIEIAFRVPAETLGRVLSAAAEAFRGGRAAETEPETVLTERRTVSEENGAFQEDVFRRLARDMEGPSTERRTSTETAEPGESAEAAGVGPEESTGKRRSRRRRARPASRELQKQAEGDGEVSLPSPLRRESGASETEEAPVRRGSGELGRRLSAPEPATYAVERLGAAERPAEERAEMAEPAPEALTAEALSRCWERDSRRYDGGFSLY